VCVREWVCVQSHGESSPISIDEWGGVHFHCVRESEKERERERKGERESVCKCAQPR